MDRTTTGGGTYLEEGKTLNQTKVSTQQGGHLTFGDHLTLPGSYLHTYPPGEFGEIGLGSVTMSVADPLQVKVLLVAKIKMSKLFEAAIHIT